MAAPSQFNQFFSKMADESEEEFTDDEDISPLSPGQKPEPGQNNEGETKAWDAFRRLPPPTGSLSEEIVPWMDVAIKGIKIFTYILTFLVVLGGGFLVKVMVLLMTSQLKVNTVASVCPNSYNFLSPSKQYVTTIQPIDGIAWGWCLFFCFLVPEAMTFLRSTRILIFKSSDKGKFIDFLVVCLCECLHVVGLVIILYVILPDLDVVRGAMLSNCFCFVPGLLGFLSREKDEVRIHMKYCLDGVALLFQFLSFIAWPILEYQRNPDNWQIWLIPVGTLFVSFGWWENYVDKNSPFRLIQELGAIKFRLWRTRYFVYLFVPIIKSCVFFCSMILALYLRYDDISMVFNLYEAFSSHSVLIYEARDSLYQSDISQSQSVFEVKSSPNAAVYVFLLITLLSYLAYIFAKFACKICIQGFSFAFPLSLTVPVTVVALVSGCGAKFSNPCAFSTMPIYIFWDCEQEDLFQNFLKDEYAWMWLLWLLSYTWITLHIWTPKCERLVSTERIFVTPMYNAFFVDQSIALNRRRDDDLTPSDIYEYDHKDLEDPDDYYEDSKMNLSQGKSKLRASDHVTRVYVCATMWHENRDEMMEFLKSILRMDEDQSARRITQQYFEVIDPDYYEFETHIYFDDAYEISDEDENEHVVNSFVKLLVSLIEEAASHVHQSEVRIRPPKKYPTPYGGRLVWILPGKTRVICHLKDKDKIRHKKRWSQVMYMYYLLGFKLMEQPIPVERKEIIAENTYLLALDGDIDFTPKAVTLLIDLMKKNKNLGAACGRIHPVGSGIMVWYQMFEYAVGHWLQKATEHVIGCVLCSPGCFALFRGKALMDDNVMARYTTVSTQARHYVQFDQGEDRWLCTLLLQRGYRVEYSAASDAYTHAPEGFGEFYNQRRRWVPSTMANIMDLLQDYKMTVKVNDNISMLYIGYQMGLMLGTIVGPGMIFLIVQGSFVAAFGISQWVAFWANLIPLIIFMVVCFTMESKYQIYLAYFLTAIYALVMVIVMIGMFINFAEEGFLNPTAIFFFGTVFIFISTGLLHPQEIICLPMGIVYYLVVPSMYLLLQIYSVFNVNNVSWGTREVATKKTKEEQEAEKKALEEAQKQEKAAGIMGLLQRNKKSKNEEGSIEISCSGLFKFMCCIQPKPDDRLQLAHNLDEIRRKLDDLSLHVTQQKAGSGQRRSTLGPRKSLHPKKSLAGPNLFSGDFNDDDDSEGSSHDSVPKEERDDLVNPYWMEDKDLKRGEVDYLTSTEIQFFKDLIEKYLRPLIKNAETQAKIAKDLKDLRNMVVFSFLMLNSIFVLVMFILDLNKDTIHINWPFGQDINITYSPTIPEVYIVRNYLELAPIGLMFVVFFGIILLVQYVGMLFHRFGTISHIMSSTELKLCDRKPKDMTEDGELEQNALAIVKDWQRPAEAKRDGGGGKSIGGDVPAGRRATLHNIEHHRVQRPVTTTLDAVFKDRYTRFTSVAVPNADNEVNVGGRRLTIRRDTINAMVERRKSVVDRRKSVAAQRRATMHQANALLAEEHDFP